MDHDYTVISLFCTHSMHLWAVRQPPPISVCTYVAIALSMYSPVHMRAAYMCVRMHTEREGDP